MMHTPINWLVGDSEKVLVFVLRGYFYHQNGSIFASLIKVAELVDTIFYRPVCRLSFAPFLTCSCTMLVDMLPTLLALFNCDFARRLCVHDYYVHCWNKLFVDTKKGRIHF